MIHTLWRRRWDVGEDWDYDEVEVAVTWTAWLLGVEVQHHGGERTITGHVGPLSVRWERGRWER